MNARMHACTHSRTRARVHTRTQVHRQTVVHTPHELRPLSPLNPALRHTPLPPGCAFVSYGSWAEAEAALKAVDQKATLPGGSHPITVKFADAKPAELAKFDGRGTKRGAWDGGMMGGGGGGGGGKRQFMGGMGRGGGMVGRAQARGSVQRGWGAVFCPVAGNGH
jgi:hypothetical protein